MSDTERDLDFELDGLATFNVTAALPCARWLAINADASRPQTSRAVRVEVALPSAIFIGCEIVALAGLLDRQQPLSHAIDHGRLASHGPPFRFRRGECRRVVFSDHLSGVEFSR